MHVHVMCKQIDFAVFDIITSCAHVSVLSQCTKTICSKRVTAICVNGVCALCAVQVDEEVLRMRSGMRRSELMFPRPSKRDVTAPA